jgi:Protein of unknown function (DUF1203)
VNREAAPAQTAYMLLVKIACEVLMSFRYKGLPVASFESYLRMSNAELAAVGARRMIADEKPSFPCRVTLEDAEIGERVLLLSFRHQDAHSPFKASGPVFVRETARETYDSNVPPPVFRAGRLLSARAYDAAGMMVDADVTESDDLELLLGKLFARDDTDYVHVHYARRGCFAARVERA